ncbi:ABC transporter permease [Salininema proteolyticum]|uniref:ABC transporter permease n=1 Tax=Salininema proteolyticum TaxID=1607685 RepID=A0ABV8TZI6_9ACTN
MTTTATEPPAPESPVGARGAAAGYRPSRTLPFRVEALRQWKRRRTLVMAGLLAALPAIMVVAFAIGGSQEDSANGSSFMDTATASGANFTAAVLFVSTGLLVVIPVALFFGDTVASEAGWSSLRYLLAAPVPRNRLLLSKLVVAFLFSLAAIVLLGAASLLIGTLAYGWGSLDLPFGGAIPAAEAPARLAIAVGYVFVSQLAVAGIAFWLSTRTDAPLGAVGGAVGFSLLGAILDQITALGQWRQFLPAHWQYSWTGAFGADVDWSEMIRGTSLSLAFAIVLFALAFRGFRTKDVVS